MKNESQEKGFIEERIESCREIEQRLAIPHFNNWSKEVGLLSNHQSSMSKVHFMMDELNLYNKIHEYKFHLGGNKIIRLWFTGSSGEIDFDAMDINDFLDQNEYNFKYTHYMHLFLSIFTLGSHRRIIPWLIKRQERKNRKQIEKLKQKIGT
ncbi:MAG: hypothetical protein KKI12_01490 [Proteobacteria bacterium]|nr:hypothetical protein [Pseudomonadota bacterium]MBU4286829.1 hypothetical protein [Pseudomonadota bacterium]MBU4414831.1 hypothetical protein [Pseudomonadota bacterium]MCG2759241.1 hypothetical protein [Desulfobacteraceae bacterium]